MVGPWDDQRRQQPPTWIQPRYAKALFGKGLAFFRNDENEIARGHGDKRRVKRRVPPTAPLERMSRH